MLNTQDLKDNLTGKNKAFITRVSNRQEKRYGNVDIFSALINHHNAGTSFETTTIEIQFGENWIEFTFDIKGKLIDTYGNGQGHKYHASIQACAEELFQKHDQLETYCL